MCSKCRFPRPERAHHCAVCNQCVMRYDHHCPWINNCVGFGNHKLFLQLSLYTWLLGFLTMISIAPLLPSCLHSMGDSTDPQGLRGWVALSLVLVSVATCMLLTVILHYHVPLAMRNLTSVEDFYDNMPNPFDQGSTMGNLAQIFGEFGPDWFLPIRPCKPVSDGVTFAGGPNEPPIMFPINSTQMPSDRSDQGLLLHEMTFEDNIMEDALTLLPCSCGYAGGGHSQYNHELMLPEERGGQMVEELWRGRYKVRPLHESGDNHFNDDLAGLEHSPRALALLGDLWGSFWFGRQHSPRRAAWL